ncbi:hypothetical protein ILUMI_04214 [Ignelater luminosus]|uniref:ACB domain-containing protein n=1 Tax=Ignelater luminosus TaxID=2038154 RepID=A0A8K0GLE7_IGNLU|nr:hypothetical protein ILUMI_04214 [Ignelater luminosus]
MSLEEKFKSACDQIRKFTKKPPDSDMLEVYSLYKQATVGNCNIDLLELYGLFKQATVGDVNTNKPGLTDLKGKAKWDAWSSRKGLSQDAAKEQYIAKATALGAL